MREQAQSRNAILFEEKNKSKPALKMQIGLIKGSAWESKHSCAMQFDRKIPKNI